MLRFFWVGMTPNFFFLSVYSFLTDYQMIVDAKIIVTVRQTTAGVGLNVETRESLYPTRHQITLPLNGLNTVFDDFSVSFNHHNKIESDR